MGGIARLHASVFLRHFWDGVMSGKYNPVDETVVRDSVDRVFFSHSPLVRLANGQERVLRTALEKKVSQAMSQDSLRLFAEREILYFPNKGWVGTLEDTGIDDFVRCSSKYYHDARFGNLSFRINRNASSPELVWGVEFPDPFGAVRLTDNYAVFSDCSVCLNDERHASWSGVLDRLSRVFDARVLSTDDKVRVFSDPEQWDNLGYHVDGRLWSCGMQGYRRLIGEYNYFDTEQAFFDTVGRVRKDTGRDVVRMLDVGGGVGKACYDAKTLDADIYPTNLTIDEEPGMHDVPTVFAAAERMPDTFREAFDLVVSNMASQYFVYPDIAMRNILRAASVGGRTHLHAYVERPPIRVSDYSERVASVRGMLDTLESGGYIRRTGGWNFQKLKLIE